MMLNDVNTPRFGIWLTGFRFHAAAPWMPRLLAAGCAAAVSLRAADAVHIDSSRAPPFLRILRKPSEMSRNHWVFQEHLQQPMVENNRLKFTSGDQFPIEEISAWWLCFDVLKMIDRELCQIDALLADIGRERLEARGVVGIEDANRLAKLVPTKDWIPIDAQIKISNIPSLIKKLGGKHLYGEDPIVPLRELIQNGCDAIRASVASNL